MTQRLFGARQQPTERSENQSTRRLSLTQRLFGARQQPTEGSEDESTRRLSLTQRMFGSRPKPTVGSEDERMRSQSTNPLSVTAIRHQSTDPLAVSMSKQLFDIDDKAAVIQHLGREIAALTAFFKLNSELTPSEQIAALKVSKNPYLEFTKDKLKEGEKLDEILPALRQAKQTLTIINGGRRSRRRRGGSRRSFRARRR